MSNIRKVNTREKLIVSAAVLIGTVVLIVSLFLEPVFNRLKQILVEKETYELKINKVKHEIITPVSSDKVIVYILNYLEVLTSKSGVKLKSFQSVSSKGVKGVSSFQLRFTANTNTLIKFLYLAENTSPNLSVGSLKVSSVSCGSYEGMRQLDGLAVVSVASGNINKKVKIASLEELKLVFRDPFSAYVKPLVIKPEPKTVIELPAIPVWTLTAAMNDGEYDYMIFKNSGESDTKYILNLKDKKDITLKILEEKVEIVINNEKIEWNLGDSKQEESIPAKLIEIIKQGDESDSSGSKEQAPLLNNKVQETDTMINLDIQKIPERFREQYRRFMRGRNRNRDTRNPGP